MRTYHLKNVLYFPGLNCVGGIETYCYEMGLKYGKDYDLTVFYLNGDPNMVDKIAETCRIIKYRTGDKIVCDTFIFGYGHEILQNVEAKEIIQTFHADYVCRHLNPSFDERITKRFGVSDNTTNGIREHFEWAKDIVTMYNPYTVKKTRKVLNLISATRLTKEKGFDRMVAFANALDAAGIPFHWDVYTDSNVKFPNKSVAVLPPRLDILDFIAKADYLVQLSNTEGYSYSIVEALSVGTPVICTALPVAEENGVQHGKTGFILPMDMSEIPIEEIYKGLRKFKYTPRESHYEEVLSPGAAEFELPNEVTVKVKKIYFDIVMNRQTEYGEQFTVSMKRAIHLEDLGLVDILE